MFNWICIFNVICEKQQLAILFETWKFSVVDVSARMSASCDKTEQTRNWLRVILLWHNYAEEFANKMNPRGILSSLSYVTLNILNFGWKINAFSRQLPHEQFAWGPKNCGVKFHKIPSQKKKREKRWLDKRTHTLEISQVEKYDRSEVADNSRILVRVRSHCLF